MVGTIVFEENGFPVELGSTREIERAVASGRLRADTLVRTGFDHGTPHLAPASEVPALRPFLGVAEPAELPPSAPAPAAAPASAPPPASRPDRLGMAGPTGTTFWQPPTAASAPRAGSPPATAHRTPAEAEESHPGLRSPAPAAKLHKPYREPDTMLARGLMPLLRYASFAGRSSVREFWTFLVLQVAGLTAVTLYDPSSALTLLVGLALVVPSIAVAVRRCHDQNRSGWLVLSAIVPYVGWLILLVMMMIPGTPGPNRHGPDPMRGY